MRVLMYVLLLPPGCATSSPIRPAELLREAGFRLRHTSWNRALRAHTILATRALRIFVAAASLAK